MENLINANKRLFEAIIKLHPMIDVSNKKEEELYLAMHECKEHINNIITEDERRQMLSIIANIENKKK